MKVKTASDEHFFAYNLPDFFNERRLGIIIPFCMKCSMHIHVNTIEVSGIFNAVKDLVHEFFKSCMLNNSSGPGISMQGRDEFDISFFEYFSPFLTF
jgi:hypothetical protein